MKARIESIESGRGYKDGERRVTLLFDIARFAQNRLTVPESALGLRAVELDMEVELEVVVAMAYAITQRELDEANEILPLAAAPEQSPPPGWPKSGLSESYTQVTEESDDVIHYKGFRWQRLMPPTVSQTIACQWMSFARGGKGWCACGVLGDERNMVTYASYELHIQGGESEICKYCGYSIRNAKRGEFEGKYVHVLTGNILCALVATPAPSQTDNSKGGAEPFPEKELREEMGLAPVTVTRPSQAEVREDAGLIAAQEYVKHTRVCGYGFEARDAFQAGYSAALAAQRQELTNCREAESHEQAAIAEALSAAENACDVDWYKYLDMQRELDTKACDYAVGVIMTKIRAITPADVIASLARRDAK